MDSNLNGDLPSDTPWWARLLIRDARRAWAWTSVQFPLWCGLALEAYEAYGEQLKVYLPPAWIPHVAAAAFFVNVALRFVKRKDGQ